MEYKCLAVFDVLIFFMLSVIVKWNLFFYYIFESALRLFMLGAGVRIYTAQMLEIVDVCCVQTNLFRSLRYSVECTVVSPSWNEVMLQWQNLQPRLWWCHLGLGMWNHSHLWRHTNGASTQAQIDFHSSGCTWNGTFGIFYFSFSSCTSEQKRNKGTFMLIFCCGCLLCTQSSWGEQQKLQRNVSSFMKET